MASGRVSKKRGKVVDIPGTPTIGTATEGYVSASVAFTANSSGKGGPVVSYTMTSNPGSVSVTGSSSPIVVAPLTAGTAYTFTVKANNATGSSELSGSSNSVTPLAIPLPTGGTIYNDGTYQYNVFTSNGTLGIGATRTVDIMIVAGGGGSGTFSNAGGGGAGGLVGFSNYSLSTGNYSCVVGAGGAKGVNNWRELGQNGTNSTVGALTAAVGGGGGKAYNAADDGGRGSNGGSGGGGGPRNGGYGYGTSGQGNNGGNASYDYGGGGGGAGGAGENAGVTYPGGRGGIGSSAYSSWGAATGTGHNSGGTRYFAGGGAGGEGVTSNNPGGGGYGVYPNSSQLHGLANTGGGGGMYYANGGNGGSGIIIVRSAL